jgi:hypothetical protein
MATPAAAHTKAAALVAVRGSPVRDLAETGTTPDGGEVMPRSAFFCTANFAALLSLIVLAVPLDRAYGDALPVEVTNEVLYTGVVNSADFPVQTSNIDDPGRIWYQDFKNPDCDGVDLCRVEFRPVPVDHVLVIRHITGVVGISGNPAFVAMVFGGSTDNQVYFSAPFAGGLSVFDHPTLFYIKGTSPGEAPILYVVTPGKNIGLIQGVSIPMAGRFPSFTIIGELVDCTVGHCR